MNKLSSKEEKELIVFIKEWLRSHGYSQKDLAEQLKIKSSRTSEIIEKLKGLHKRGGIINIAMNLIRIEQHLISTKSNNSINTDTESKSSSKSDNSEPMTKYTSKILYRKRIKSIDYIRDNNDDEYNVVMSYQKYVPKRTLSSGARFDANRIKINST